MVSLTTSNYKSQINSKSRSIQITIQLSSQLRPNPV